MKAFLYPQDVPVLKRPYPLFSVWLPVLNLEEPDLEPDLTWKSGQQSHCGHFSDNAWSPTTPSIFKSCFLVGKKHAQQTH